MVQEGTPSLNVTLKGCPMKFWGLLGEVAHKTHKTHRMTVFHPIKGGLSLTLTDQGQTYNPKWDPQWLPNQSLGFGWDGSTHRTHNTMKFSGSPNQTLLLV